MKKGRKTTLLILLVAFLSAGIYVYFYWKSEPDRYNQQQLELVKLPKGLSKTGNVYCEEARIAWHELFLFLFEHPEYREMNPDKFKGVYNAEHDYMLMEKPQQLFERFEISDVEEQQKINDFNMRCFEANLKCYKKYFGMSKD